MRTTRFALCMLALTLTACAKPQTAEQRAAADRADSDSARAAIEQLAASFSAHASAGHVDSLLGFYAPNATLMPPNMPAATGPEGIRAAFQALMAGGTPTLHVSVQSVSASGDIAIDRGKYHLTIPAAAGAPAVSDSGKYLAHWHRIDGRWMMVEDIWNSDLPAMPMPAPRR